MGRRPAGGRGLAADRRAGNGRGLRARVDRDAAAFGRNAIGSALLAGADELDRNDFRGLRRVIDFSGDSIGNFAGPPIETVRAAVLAGGITINGLPILCRNCATGSGSTRASLAEDFRSRIIGGPGAFVVAAETRDSFAGAVKRKQVLEIVGRMPEPEGPGAVFLSAP